MTMNDYAHTTVLPEFQHILTTWEQGWRTLDRQLLASVWDTTSPHLLYIAEELQEPLQDWQTIRDYYRHITAMMESFNVTFKLLKSGMLHNGAYMLCEGTWSGKNRQRTTISGGTTRVYILAHYHEQQLKVIHYIEATVNMRYMTSSS